MVNLSFRIKFFGKAVLDHTVFIREICLFFKVIINRLQSKEEKLKD